MRHVLLDAARGKNRHKRKGIKVTLTESNKVPDGGGHDLLVPAPELTNNAEFLPDIFSYLSHGAYPIDTARPLPIDTYIAIEPKQVDYLKIALYGVVSGVLFLSGGGLLLRRRRR